RPGAPGASRCPPRFGGPVFRDRGSAARRESVTQAPAMWSIGLPIIDKLEDLFMASALQIDANRRNASRSTGPTTATGKATSSKNAVRHGLFSKDVLLHDERVEDFDAFREAFETCFAAVGPLEEFLVEGFIMGAWRL